MAKHTFDRVRKIALALPDVNERISHGAPCFFIRNKLPICYYHDNHRGDGRISLWCPAAPGVQDTMVFVDPARFFRPVTSDAGHFKHWVGVFLDQGHIDWNEISTIIARAYHTMAPKGLAAKLDRGAKLRRPARKGYGRANR
jgi:hypothetical protein